MDLKTKLGVGVLLLLLSLHSLVLVGNERSTALGVCLRRKGTLDKGIFVIHTCIQ